MNFRRYPSILIISLIVITACGDDDITTPEGTPNCIEKKISDIANMDVWNPPAKVYSYQYSDQLVYYFSARCCDIFSTLYDKNCNILCSPDGGLTGKGDGLCPNFFMEATDEKLIWEDDRK